MGMILQISCPMAYTKAAVLRNPSSITWETSLLIIHAVPFSSPDSQPSPRNPEAPHRSSCPAPAKRSMPFSMTGTAELPKSPEISLQERWHWQKQQIYPYCMRLAERYSPVLAKAASPGIPRLHDLHWENHSDWGLYWHGQSSVSKSCYWTKLLAAAGE